MHIQTIILAVTMFIGMVIREVFVQRQIKKYRVTISTLLYIISEDPETFEKVMKDIYNIEGLEELE